MPPTFNSRLSNRVLYAALLLLSVAGAMVVASRYSAEMEHSQRLLLEDLRARSVSLDQSLHVVQSATAALAKEAGRRAPGGEQPLQVGDLLRIAYNSRGTSDIAGFLYVGPGGSACAPEGAAECPQWLAKAAEDREPLLAAETRWTAPRPTENGEMAIANVVPAGPPGGGRAAALVAAEVRLSSLSKYTMPVHTVDSVVSLLDESGHVIVDGDGGVAVGTLWSPAGARRSFAPERARSDILGDWVGSVTKIGAGSVAIDRVSGPGWFMLAKVPTATLVGEAATATSTLAITVLVVLIILWSGMVVVEFKVLRPARAAGKKLSETLSDLEVTFAAVSDGIALFDSGCRLVACNDHFRSLLGHDEDLLTTGSRIPAILNRQDDGDRGDSEGTRTFQVVNPQGRWVEARLRDWAIGGRSGIVVVLTDVTERREATERLTAAKSQAERALADLQQAQVQLVEAEKLAALGGLVAGVAHEINTPIGVAMSAATSLAEITRQFIKELEQGAVRRSAFERYMATMGEAVRLVERNLGRASDLICHFKQVAVDRTSCQRRSFDLREVVTDVVGTLYPAVKRTGFKVDVEIAPGIVLDGYPGALGQVITNLVTNALTHAFEGRSDGRIVLAGQCGENGDIALFCRDDGIGMNAGVLKRMFEPFFTTKRGRGGSGLGMHIVYSLVTGLMGGEIAVRSAPDAGTEIRMALPRRAPDSETPADGGNPSATMRDAGELEGDIHVQ